jgi:tol-pal system protein YbgF
MREARMSRKMILATALLGAVATLSTGCAPQLDRIEVAVQDNHDEISQLKAENKRLLQELQALGQLLRMEQDSGTETSAMSFAKLSQVSGRLDQLLQKLDDNTEYMRDLSARVDLLATRSGLPTLGEYKPPTPGADTASPLTEEGRSIFAAAELDRSRGNIELARSGFQEFLDKFPLSEEADDATYWLGDLAYGDAEFKQALDLFQAVIRDYPASERVPSAMYKARACLLALDRKDEAWAIGGDLMDRYPDSSEAELLREETSQQR